MYIFENYIYFCNIEIQIYLYDNKTEQAMLIVLS